MSFRTIVTVSPATVNTEILGNIDSKGDCIYRLNGAHVNSEQATRMITDIRKILPNAKIMIDLPGNKIRTKLEAPIKLVKDKCIGISSEQLNYPDFYKLVNVGDIVYANDYKYSFRVDDIGIEDKLVILQSNNDGELKTGKGLHVNGINKQLPFLFDRDLELINCSVINKIEYLSMSYVRDKADILEVKNILKKSNSKLELFAKIETEDAVKNLGEIFEVVDNVNIDRGDLSADIGLENLPRTQERIVRSAIRANKNIFLATQFLTNMETYPIPLISEIIGLHDSILNGISGIQLSEETAIGKYPVECVELVFNVYRNSFNG